jgi:hypothetical protein
VEKPLDDRCNTTTKVATAGDASPAKTAAGIAVYLLEELGDARLRCAQLKKYVSEAQQLVEKSTHRDHFFEVAAHLIQGIPDALFKLEKALDAAAMSAARMDYEEIKQNLKPEKVEELETVLQDARVRYLQRRSGGGVSNAKQAAAEIRRIADVSDATGRVPVEDVMVLLASLERGGRTAGSKVSASDRLRELAASVETRTNPSRIEIAKSLRSFLADSVQPTASQSAVAVMQQANSREEVMKGFKESNPDLTEEQLKRIADEWEKNKSVVKDKSAAVKADIESGLKKDESDLVKIKKDIAKLEKGEKVENLTLDGAKDVEKGLSAVIENKKKLLSKLSSHHAEQVEGSHHESAQDEEADKKASAAVIDAASSLVNGGRMLGVNKPVALMMLASGVQGLGEALHSCGLPSSASSLKYAGELLQNAAKKTLSTL